MALVATLIPISAPRDAPEDGLSWTGAASQLAQRSLAPALSLLDTSKTIVTRFSLEFAIPIGERAAARLHLELPEVERIARADLPIVLRNLPAAVSLSRGWRGADKHWHLMPGDLPHLYITVPDDAPNAFEFLIEARQGAAAAAAVLGHARVHMTPDPPEHPRAPREAGTLQQTVAIPDVQFLRAAAAYQESTFDTVAEETPAQPEPIRAAVLEEASRADVLGTSPQQDTEPRSTEHQAEPNSASLSGAGDVLRHATRRAASRPLQRAHTVRVPSIAGQRQAQPGLARPRAEPTQQSESPAVRREEGRDEEWWRRLITPRTQAAAAGLP